MFILKTCINTWKTLCEIQIWTRKNLCKFFNFIFENVHFQKFSQVDYLNYNLRPSWVPLALNKKALLIHSVKLSLLFAIINQGIRQKQWLVNYKLDIVFVTSLEMLGILLSRMGKNYLYKFNLFSLMA